MIQSFAVSLSVWILSNLNVLELKDRDHQPMASGQGCYRDEVERVT